MHGQEGQTQGGPSGMPTAPAGGGSGTVQETGRRGDAEEELEPVDQEKLFRNSKQLAQLFKVKSESQETNLSKISQYTSFFSSRSHG